MQVTVPPLSTIIGFAIATLAIAFSMVSIIMIGKINEKLPESERMSYIVWRTTASGLRRRYRELYPHGKLVVVFDICLVTMVIAIVTIVFGNF